MAQVDCNGCTQCCEWGAQKELIKPNMKLATTPQGHCIYLERGKGCKLYGKPERPVNCEKFTCLDILAQAFSQPHTQPLTAVIVAAARLEARLEQEYNDKMKKEKEENGNRRSKV